MVLLNNEWLIDFSVAPSVEPLKSKKKIVTGKEAKRIWERLRNNHRDALRRQKTQKPKSGAGPSNRGAGLSNKLWRLQDQMAFLIPYMAIRTSTSNSKSNEEIDGNDEAQSESQESELDNEESQVNEQEIDQQAEQSSTDIYQARKKRYYKRNILNDFVNRSIRSMNEHEEALVNSRRERERLINNRTNDFTVSNVKNDSLFHFFISMYESTKILSSLSQHTIKNGLFSLVSQEESKQLLQHQPCTNSRNTKSTEIDN